MGLFCKHEWHGTHSSQNMFGYGGGKPIHKCGKCGAEGACDRSGNRDMPFMSSNSDPVAYSCSKCGQFH